MFSIAVALAAIVRLSLASTTEAGFLARSSTPNIFEIQAKLGPKLSKGASLYFPATYAGGCIGI